MLEGGVEVGGDEHVKKLNLHSFKLCFKDQWMVYNMTYQPPPPPPSPQ